MGKGRIFTPKAKKKNNNNKEKKRWLYHFISKDVAKEEWGIKIHRDLE